MAWNHARRATLARSTPGRSPVIGGEISRHKSHHGDYDGGVRPSAIRGEDIFRLPHRASATYVSERFVARVNAANLRGLEFNEVPPLLFASSLLKAFILEVEALVALLKSHLNSVCLCDR